LPSSSATPLAAALGIKVNCVVAHRRVRGFPPVLTRFLLGIVGVYGVLSYLVAQRTREMGVRLALGARPSDVRRMVVRQGARLGAAGAVVGLAAAVGLTKLMSVLLFGVSAIDPVTYGLVTVALIGAVLLASYLPARRAAAVDPTDALRWE